MAEHEVMWIGRRPAALAPVTNAAATEDFAAAITDACAACGGTVADYVAAAGVYGSWLVRFDREGRQQRLVWNGKDGQLVLEQAGPGNAWTMLASRPVSARELPHFVAAVREILGGEDHAPQA